MGSNRDKYFDKLFNEENRHTTFWLDDSFDDTNRCFVHKIQGSEVREALKRMKWVRRRTLIVA
jgi:3-deoxy-D-manno-octulosonic acid (KDO) 8-phosphate synthase